MALLRFAAFSLALCILAGLATAKNLDLEVPDSKSSDPKKPDLDSEPDVGNGADISDPKENDAKEEDSNGPLAPPMYAEYWNGPLHRGPRGYAPPPSPFYDPVYFWGPYRTPFFGYPRFGGSDDRYPSGPSDESGETEGKDRNNEPKGAQ
uniref:Putative secreted protein n=1 Tax=Amblyomma cajennense TaxID=34607 RepID=A0A023FCP3_AMBCJ